MFKLIITVKDTYVAMNLCENTLCHVEHTIPSFWPLCKALLDVLYVPLQGVVEKTVNPAPGCHPTERRPWENILVHPHPPCLLDLALWGFWLIP